MLRSTGGGPDTGLQQDRATGEKAAWGRGVPSVSKDARLRIRAFAHVHAHAHALQTKSFLQGFLQLNQVCGPSLPCSYVQDCHEQDCSKLQWLPNYVATICCTQSRHPALAKLLFGKAMVTKKNTLRIKCGLQLQRPACSILCQIMQTYRVCRRLCWSSTSVRGQWRACPENIRAGANSGLWQIQIQSLT